MTAPSVSSPRDADGLPAARDIWLTPFWFRVFVAGAVVVAAVAVSFTLASTVVGPGVRAVEGGILRLAIGGVPAVVVGAAALRFFNPLDRRRWFRFALTAEGVHFPGRGSGFVFVPWSAVVAVDVKRWHGKGEHSAARLTLDLDEETWSRFSRGARIEGEGRVRRVLVRVIDMTGDEIAARIDAARADSPAACC